MFRLASLAAALVVGAGVALAPHANAAPYPDEYIGWLQYKGVSYTSEQDAIDAGFTLCSAMRGGHLIESGLLGDVGDVGVFTTDRSLDALTVIYSASFALCPDTAEGLLGSWLPSTDLQRWWDEECRVTPGDPGCNVPPAGVAAMRLAERDNPATRWLLRALCVGDSEDVFKNVGKAKLPRPLCDVTHPGGRSTGLAETPTQTVDQTPQSLAPLSSSGEA